MSSTSFNNSSSPLCTNGSCIRNNTGHFRMTFAEESEQLRVFRIVVLGLILFASLVGNSLVIRAILGKRSKPFVYCLVTNLAVGELITTICIPFIITYTELKTWVFGEFLCRLIIPLNATSSTVVTTTIAVISIRRYQVVTGVGMNFPATKRGAQWLVIGAIWAYALAVCSPLFIYYRSSTQFTAKVVYCVAIYPDTGVWYGAMYQQYSIARFVLSYGIQVAVMILSYGAVTVNIKKQVQSIIKNARARVDSTQSITRVTDYNLNAHRTSSPPSVHQMVPLQQIITRAQEDHNTRQRPKINMLLDQEGDLTKMFYIIVVVFIVFYLPANIYYILEVTRSFTWFKYMFIVRTYLGLLSSLTLALHPLCYGTMSRFYAKAFKKLMLCKC